jgi:hypothetical protein
MLARAIRRGRVHRLKLLAALVTAALSSICALSQVKSDQGQFNREGNILISDQFNNRVIEVTPDGGIVWQFGLGPDDFSANSPLGVNDAQRVGDLTLVAGTGIPPGVDSHNMAGAADNRVMLVDPLGGIVWQYGQFGVTGSDPNELNTPVQATWLPNSHVLITD